jgi:hypothetical protein
MKRVAGQVDGGHTEIGDLDPFGIFVFVELSAHLEAGFGCRRGDQLNDRAIAARDIRLLRQEEQIASDARNTLWSVKLASRPLEFRRENRA